MHLAGGAHVALEAFGHRHPAVRKAGSPAAPFQSQARLLPAQGPEGRIFEALLLARSRSVRLNMISIAFGSEMEARLDCVRRVVQFPIPGQIRRPGTSPSW